MRILSVFTLICCLFLAACSGPSATAALDADKADSGEIAAAPDKIEIRVGMKDSAVLQLLGPADSTDADGSGRSLWRYSGKRAEYVYVSNRDNVQTLVIGGYIADPANPRTEREKRSPGLPLLMTIVFDPAKKVVNFNFAQMAF